MIMMVNKFQYSIRKFYIALKRTCIFHRFAHNSIIDEQSSQHLDDIVTKPGQALDPQVFDFLVVHAKVPDMPLPRIKGIVPVLC